MLTALSEQDVLETNWFDWFNDEEATQFMQQHYYPNNRELQLQFFRNNISGSRTNLQLGIVPKGMDGIVGVISLSAIDPINRKAELNMIIGEKKYRNMTNSVEAMVLMLRHGFDNLNLRRIWGGTTSEDLANLMCRVLGFRHEGVRREDIYKKGKYMDTYNIGLLRHEFVSGKSPQSQA